MWRGGCLLALPPRAGALLHGASSWDPACGPSQTNSLPARLLSKPQQSACPKITVPPPSSPSLSLYRSLFLLPPCLYSSLYPHYIMFFLLSPTLVIIFYPHKDSLTSLLFMHRFFRHFLLPLFSTCMYCCAPAGQKISQVHCF